MTHTRDAARAVRKVISRPDRLRGMAAELEAEADQLRRKAEEIEDDRRDDERIARRKRLIRTAALAVAAGGSIAAEAEKLSAALTGERSASVTDCARVILWQCDNARHVLAFRRDREIMQLARRGWSNAEISAQLPRLGFKAVHPKSVSRIVQQHLRGNL